MGRIKYPGEYPVERQLHRGVFVAVEVGGMNILEQSTPLCCGTGRTAVRQVLEPGG